jgi:hypothetical protein
MVHTSCGFFAVLLAKAPVRLDVVPDHLKAWVREAGVHVKLAKTLPTGLRRSV